jgi:cytochrome c oxidase subunit 1
MPTRCLYLVAWVNIPEYYYRSVTGHGTVMAYVFPMLVAMGFGYAIAELSLKQALIGIKWAWTAFGLTIVGASTAAAAIASGAASVLYTFYPPLIANPFFYIGIVLVVVGSWIWVVLMTVNLRAWSQYRTTYSPGDVRESCRCLPVGVDRRRRSP